MEDMTVENWTPPKLKPEDYEGIMDFMDKVNKKDIPVELILTLYNPLIPYLYKKKQYKKKAIWKPDEKDGRILFCGVSFIELISKKWCERTERLMGNTLTQNRIEQIMNEPPLVSQVQSQKIMNFIYRLTYSEPKPEVLQTIN